MRIKRLTVSFFAILAFLVLGILIAVQLKNVNTKNAQSEYAEKDLTELQEQVMALMRENDSLSEQNRQLSSLISSMGEELSGDNDALQVIMTEKAKAEAFAGLTDVHGPGLMITVDPGQDASVNAKTLLLLINELRASGALAISINDERIVAMSEIRDTGTDKPQIVMNGNSYEATSPFTVKSIYRESDINRGLQLIQSLIEQLGTASDIVVSNGDDIQIKALSEDSLANQPT